MEVVDDLLQVVDSLQQLVVADHQVVELVVQFLVFLGQLADQRLLVFQLLLLVFGHVVVIHSGLKVRSFQF